MIEKLKDSLHKGKVSFSFKKADGTLRQAVGTLHPSLLPLRNEGETSTRVQPPHLQVYYDLGSGGFRSFRIDSLVSVGDLELISDTPVSGIPAPELPTNLKTT